MGENSGKETTVSEIASRGGKARAEKLSPEERSEKAQEGCPSSLGKERGRQGTARHT